jgi:hypothetical protein
MHKGNYLQRGILELTPLGDLIGSRPFDSIQIGHFSLNNQKLKRHASSVMF